MEQALRAEVRTSEEKGSVKKLRREGKVPAVAYGKAMASIPLSVDEKDLMQLLRGNPPKILNLDVAGQGMQSVMIRDMQRDKLHQHILHIDFLQVRMDQPITTAVRIDYVGESAGVKAGGLLQVQLHELQIRCLPQHMPAAIEADISGLEIAGHLLAGDLPLPQGVELRQDPDDVLVTILAAQKEGLDHEEEDPQKANAEASGASAVAEEPHNVPQT